MLHDSPLRDRHTRFATRESERVPAVEASERPGAATGHRVAAELEYLPYATPSGTPVCELIAAFGPVEPEYAAIRRGAALIDAPQRGTILVTGKDRREFLQRLVTQDVGALTAGRIAESFWLNRKGRIDADLIIAEMATGGGAATNDRMLILVDAGLAGGVAESLGSFLFGEEVALQDASADWHWLELHGPAAGRSLALAGAKSIPGVGETTVVEIAGVEVVLLRQNTLGENGWWIGCPRSRAGEVWDGLLEVTDPLEGGRMGVRPIGWHAANIARVEAGTPLFQIDFGTSNLPHETGLLRARVSFRKGCYLGQEVVARMESLGKPKQVLVGLRPQRDLLPVAGAQVFERAQDGTMGPAIGVVTSSTLSPMLGAVPIALAMVKTTNAQTGTSVLVNAEGEQCDAIVGALRSWPLATEAVS